MRISATIEPGSRITLPSALREALGAVSGEHIEFLRNERGNFDIKLRKGNLKNTSSGENDGEEQS
jgi:bifunctional DNA-binding transcriptional regulator/antitoxin component of YhaV-PrlF toxin-antitoxin module